MTKYNFILLKKQHENFLADLRELGLVDITTTQWSASDSDRALMSLIDKYNAAKMELSSVESADVEAFTSGEEAFEAYSQAKALRESLIADIHKSNKEIDALKIWGDFSLEQIKALESQGLTLNFYSAYKKEYYSSLESWQTMATIVAMNPDDDTIYFVAINQTGELDSQSLRLPEMNYTQKLEHIKSMEKSLDECAATMTRCAASVALLDEQTKKLSAELRYSQVYSAASDEAENTLVVMEGWAAKDSAQELDTMLNSCSGLVYLKSEPTPQDDTPVLLKNNKFASLFELIGAFYALPRYGTLDLTKYLAPFYMIFFGFCLGDGGYGLIFVLAGIFLKVKKIKGMEQISSLTLLCGISTVVFGFLTGSFFGVQLANVEALGDLRRYILSADNLFNLAIGIGIFQILLAMTLKVISISIQTSFKYALAPLGWMIVIISTLVAALLELDGYSMSSLAYQCTAGLGLVLMLFLNNPDKNPLANFGVGLWNTYNDITGLMGDILSYIRLFAIGLSGSILALVFNDLAFGMSPDIPVVGTIVSIIILLVGHGINLFMSSLSSFVHPLRLTFVEFYKNAGFESTLRAFTPFKNENK